MHKNRKNNDNSELLNISDPKYKKSSKKNNTNSNKEQ